VNPDIEKIPVVDTHEHISFAFAWKPEEIGLLHVLFGNHYLLADLYSSDPGNAGGAWDGEGAPYDRLTDPSRPATSAERNSLLDCYIEYLPRVQMTSDWKSMRIALRDLYGLREELPTMANRMTLEKRIRDLYRQRADWSYEILERARIETLFWCYGRPKLREHCRGVLSLAVFLERLRGEVKDSNGLESIFCEWFEEEKERFTPVALKMKSAYSRNLDFVEREAGEVDEALSGMGAEDTLGSSIIVSDFIHDLAAHHAASIDMPVQIHTGYLAGNAFIHSLSETYALQLEPFIAHHPGTKFDLFHGSFPQWGEAVLLCRRYPNVYLNMCWVPTISESMAESMLRAALEACPANKIMWGGDAHSLEMAYGALSIFRGILSRVVESSNLSASAQFEIAEWVLWRSASGLYSL
jgi:hypothetical protein